MKQGQIETIKIRIISTCFVVAALTVFKPFGLDTYQLITYLHFFVLLVPGFLICMLTDAILKYILKMPRSSKHGVDYIIKRNLRFQLINTPLVSLFICLYRHYVINNYVEGNQLSWTNYFETLLIIGFCSFIIGLYWRFKFRSRFLAAELEETKQINEQLNKIQTQQQFLSLPDATSEEGKHENHETESVKDGAIPAISDKRKEPSTTSQPCIVLSGTTSETITLNITDLLYVEAVGNYVKVYHLCGDKVRTDMLRTTSKQMEDDLRPYNIIVRCHRAFLVNLAQVERAVSQSGSMQLVIKHCLDTLPVSRSNMSQIKETLKKGI